nr:nonaspanin [Tanacetum cinerariifolium]
MGDGCFFEADGWMDEINDLWEDGCLRTVLKTADPTKVRVAERKHVENEPRLLETTSGHVVLLLPIAPARASSELEASVDYLFDEGASEMDKSLFTGAALNAEARDEPIPTLPFVTSSVSATPERKDKSLADFVTGLNLRTIGASQRYSAPTIAIVTTVTAMVDADTTADRVPVEPSFFGVGSSSTGRTDFVPGGFFNVSGSDFLIGGIRTIFLSAEVRMRAEYNIREKRMLRTVVDEQTELLKVRDGEIESLKAQLLLKKAESAEAIRLRAEVFKFKAAEKSLQVKCLNSIEYLSALGATIRKAVEKGMQEGLSAGITHGAEGRKLADVAAYNPSAEADYLSALQRLQNVNFSLIAELKSNKDAIVDTIMNLLRLDDALAERLGLTESQPHANQVMEPIHHSPDQRVVGTEGTTGSAYDTTTTLSVTFVSAGTIPPISTDDYEVAHADGQGVLVWMMKPHLLGT